MVQTWKIEKLKSFKVIIFIDNTKEGLKGLMYLCITGLLHNDGWSVYLSETAGAKLLGCSNWIEERGGTSG